MERPTDGAARFAARFLRISYGIFGAFLICQLRAHLIRDFQSQVGPSCSPWEMFKIFEMKGGL